MATILILSGAGRYADPWHPFAETSGAIAQILTAAGHQVEVRETTTPEVLDPAGFDLVVVNCGVGPDPSRPAPTDPEWANGFAALGGWIDAGGPVLGTHTAANTFNDWPRWVEILGGRWTRGVSMHPERSVAVFEAVPEAESHPVVDGLGLVIAYDERYSFLHLHDDAVPLMQHETAEVFHTCVWQRGRAIYDGLGHDARSYDGAGRQELLLREVDLLVDPR